MFHGGPGKVLDFFVSKRVGTLFILICLCADCRGWKKAQPDQPGGLYCVLSFLWVKLLFLKGTA